MPIGVGAAMLIGSAVAGGTALAGAKIQSNAAGKAQREQQAATDRALAVQRQANQPYMDLGAAAAGRLGQMGANPQPYTQVFGSGAGAQAFQPPRGGSLASLGQPQPPTGMGQPPPGPMGAPQGPPRGQMVRVQAPTGEIAALPAGSPQLMQALQRGARQVG